MQVGGSGSRPPVPSLPTQRQAPPPDNRRQSIFNASKLGLGLTRWCDAHCRPATACNARKLSGYHRILTYSKFFKLISDVSILSWESHLSNFMAELACTCVFQCPSPAVHKDIDDLVTCSSSSCSIIWCKRVKGHSGDLLPSRTPLFRVSPH